MGLPCANCAGRMDGLSYRGEPGDDDFDESRGRRAARGKTAAHAWCRIRTDRRRRPPVLLAGHFRAAPARGRLRDSAAIGRATLGRRRGGNGRRVLRRCARRSDVLHGRIRSGSRCVRDRGHPRALARRRDQYRRHVRDGRGRLHLGSAVRGARAARRAHAILGTAVRSVGHDRRRTVAELDPVGLGALRSVGRERAGTRRGARGRQPARDRSRRTAARRSHSCATTDPT